MHVHCYKVSMQKGNRNKTSCKYQQQILLQRKQKFTLFVRQFTSIYKGWEGKKKKTKVESINGLCEQTKRVTSRETKSLGFHNVLILCQIKILLIDMWYIWVIYNIFYDIILNKNVIIIIKRPNCRLIIFDICSSVSSSLFLSPSLLISV